MKSYRSIKALLSFALSGWCASGLTVWAQTWTGGGTDDNWSTPGNWSTAVPANNGSADIVFAGGLRLNPLVDVPWAVRSINFDGSALGFTLSSAPLGIGSLGVRNDSAAMQTLNNAVTLLGPQSWRAVAGPLVFGGAVANEGHALTISGAQMTSLLGPVSGAGRISKLDAGTLRLTGASSFSGGLVLNDGVLVLGSDAALGSGPLVPLAGRIVAEGGARTLPNAVVVASGATPQFDSPFNVTLTGDVSVDGNRSWQVDNIGVVTLAGSVGQMPGAASLTKLGTGVLALSGGTPNTLAGPMSVLEGELRLGKTSGTTAVAGDLAIGGLSVAATVLLEANDQIADTADLEVNRLARLDLNGSSDRIQDLEINGGEVTTGGGVLTLQGINSLGGDTTGQINGRLNLGGAIAVMVVARGSAPVDLRINAIISNGGAVKVGNGVLVLGGANDFSQGLTLAGGTLGVAHDQAAGTGPLRLGAGKIQGEGAARTLGNVVELGIFYGIDQPTFSGAQDLTFSGPTQLGGTPVWTVENTGRTIFSGPIGEPQPGGGLTKVGPGDLLFTGTQANTYTGLTAVREGLLLLNKSAGVNAITGALDIGGTAVPAVVRLGASEQIGDASRMFIRTGGLLDLNGFVETGTLELAGGRVETGAGRFVLANDLQTDMSGVTATIAGALDLGGAPRTFNVADGPQEVDLHVAAGIVNGTIYKTGAGRLLLTANSAFAGGLALLSGSLSVGSDTAVGSGPLLLTSPAASLRAESGARALSNPFGLHGNITLEGPNDLLLSGPGTLSGKSFLIVQNHTVITGAIGERGGAQRLTKQGPGILELAGANSFTGGFVVSAGRVELQHMRSAGNGLLVVSGGSVVLGGIPETVEAGPTLLSSNGVFVARLAGPRNNALLRVNGNLVLGGRLDVEAGPGFGPGTYRLIDYTGGLGLQPFTLGSMPGGFSYQVVTTNVGRVDLIVGGGVQLEVNCPAGMTVNCLAEVPAQDVNTLQLVQSGCGAVVRSFVGDSYVTNGNTITITRTYRVTDACSATATCTQIIVVNQGNVPAPQLSIRREGANVVICWEHPCVSFFVLEEETDLNTPRQWTASTATVTLNGQQACVTVPASGNKFFRLRAP